MNRKERRALERQKINTEEAKTEEFKPKKSYNKYIIFIVIIAVFIGAIFFSYSKGQVSGEYDDFVACLAERDVKFYASYQCPHCQEQKRDFGKSVRLLESLGVYIECGPLGSFSTECTSKGVTSVPHWVVNGEAFSGRQSLLTLSEKSGCSLTNEIS